MLGQSSGSYIRASYIYKILFTNTIAPDILNLTVIGNAVMRTAKRCSLLTSLGLNTSIIPYLTGCVSLTRSEATNSYDVNANHDKPPEFCLVLPKEEINIGKPYTMTVKLMNVSGKDGVNHGHPGVMYNVIDENNFDFAYFRFVA